MGNFCVFAVNTHTLNFCLLAKAQEDKKIFSKYKFEYVWVSPSHPLMPFIGFLLFLG